MSNSWYAVIRWGGKKISNEFGVDYENGYSKTTTVPKELNFRILHDKIRDVMKLGENEEIQNIEFRFPITMSGERKHYNCLQVFDNDDVYMMLGIMNSNVDMYCMELFIECGECGECGQCDEAGPSNYVPYNEEEDSGHGEEDVEDGGDGEDVGNDEYDDEESEYEDDDEEGDEESEEDEIEQQVSEVHNTVYASNDGVWNSTNFNPTFFPNIPFYTECDRAAMSMHPHGDNTNAVVWNPSMNLAKGMLFKSRDAVRNAAKDYSTRVQREFQSRETKGNTITLVCKQCDDGCKWRLRATCKKKNGFLWEITRYEGEHTCEFLQSQENRNLDTNFLLPIVEAMMLADPLLKVRVIQFNIKQRYKIEISYKKAWMAKMKAIGKIYGDWEESYNHLRPWMHAACAVNPGSQYNLDTIPYWVDRQIVPDVKCFESIVWFWQPCVDGFKNCQPVLYVDGTFLTGRYKGVLLIASALDGNNTILPVGFAIVEVENNQNWDYFMRSIRAVVCPDRDDVCVVSDRHAGILAAMRYECWEMAPHRYCIRHLSSNYNTHFNRAYFHHLEDLLRWSNVLIILACHLINNLTSRNIIMEQHT